MKTDGDDVAISEANTKELLFFVLKDIQVIKGDWMNKPPGLILWSVSVKKRRNSPIKHENRRDS